MVGPRPRGGGPGDEVDVRRRSAPDVLARLPVRDPEQLYRTIVAGALDAVVAIDDEGQITEWNPRAEAIVAATSKGCGASSPPGRDDCSGR